MDKTDEAIGVFKRRYGKTPEEAGFPVIGVYEKQNTFLYASSKDVIRAYRTQQNILRWILAWTMWPLTIVMLSFVVVLFLYRDFWNPWCLVIYAFLGVWWILIIILGIKVRRTSRLIKFGNSFTYLNYEK